MYSSGFDLITQEAPDLVCHQSVLNSQVCSSCSPLCKVGIAQVTDIPDLSVDLPFVLNSCVNSFSFEFNYRGVASVKLNYKAEPVWAPKERVFFLKICCSFLALLPDVDMELMIFLARTGAGMSGEIPSGPMIVLLT